MLSGNMLPIHFPPEPDELLTSWYVRLAHANRLKTETFGTILWGRQYQLWIRDIDRLSPEWLVDKLSIKTGTPLDVSRQTTLKAFEGKLFPILHPTGISAWILPVQKFNRKYLWPGMQFCPMCLKDDAEPYFRKRWRLSISTVCRKHNVLLHNHCPKCNSAIMFHRRDMGKAKELDFLPLSLCHNCNYDLRSTKVQRPEIYDEKSSNLAADATAWLESGKAPSKDLSFYIVLHQFCKLLVLNSPENDFREFVRKRMKITPGRFKFDATPQKNRNCFEHYSVVDRENIMNLAYWLLVDPVNRLSDVLNLHVVTTNKLYKDINLMPSWFQDIINHLPHRDIPRLSK